MCIRDRDVRKGEILGIAGVEGNGQKELAEVITGIRKPSDGTVEFNGKNINRLSVKERFDMGISYISDDRHSDSLVTVSYTHLDVYKRQTVS